MKTNLNPLIGWTGLLAAGYAWKFLGMEGAGNLLAAFLWFAGAIGVFMICSEPKSARSYVTPRFVAAYGWACYWLLMAGLLWFGHFGYAALLGLMALGMQVYGARFNADGTLKSAAEQESSHGA